MHVAILRSRDGRTALRAACRADLAALCDLHDRAVQAIAVTDFAVRDFDFDDALCCLQIPPPPRAGLRLCVRDCVGFSIQSTLSRGLSTICGRLIGGATSVPRLGLVLPGRGTVNVAPIRALVSELKALGGLAQPHSRGDLSARLGSARLVDRSLRTIRRTLPVIANRGLASGVAKLAAGAITARLAVSGLALRVVLCVARARLVLTLSVDDRLLIARREAGRRLADSVTLADLRALAARALAVSAHVALLVVRPAGLWTAERHAGLDLFARATQACLIVAVVVASLIVLLHGAAVVLLQSQSFAEHRLLVLLLCCVGIHLDVRQRQSLLGARELHENVAPLEPPTRTRCG